MLPSASRKYRKRRPAGPFDLGDLLRAVTGSWSRADNIGDHVPNLLAGSEVLGFAAALDERNDTRFAEIEMNRSQIRAS
jgi:hypothetical protein